MNNPPQGTEFQRKVWSELLLIPERKTLSYKEIENKIDHPNSARAIANACSKNPMPKKIPCHGAIRSDGSIGGYSAPGGVSEKFRLIEKERKSSRESYETRI